MKNKLKTGLGEKTPAINWLNKVTEKNKWKIIVLLILQSLLGILTIAYAMILRGLVDSAVFQNKQSFMTSVFGLLGIILLQTAIQGVGQFLEENARASVENRLKQRLFSILLKKEYGAVTAVHSGEWMNRMTSDTVVVADGVVQILPRIAGMVIKMVGAFMMILIMEPVFGIIIIPGGILLVCITYVFRKYLKRLHKNIQEKDGRLRVFFQENLGSLLVVRSFAVEAQCILDANEKMQEHKQARIKRIFFSGVSNMAFSLAMKGAYVVCAVYCAYGIMNGNVTYGTFTAMLQLISQIQSPIANISSYFPKYYAMVASAERLMEAEALTDTDIDSLLPMEMIQSYYETEFKEIVLENVSFTYLPSIAQPEDLRNNSKDEMPVVLNAINFRIRKGDYVAFTGHSGCGKSTVLKLLMCLYSLDEGNRFLINQNGKKQKLTGSWQKLFAYVPQGNHLMSGSIREIIAFANKECINNEKMMRRAIKIACAEEFIDTLSEGIDTVLGERGQGLSEGQIQRIAIARAVFSDNPILILDESTSALDEETEKKVLENLRKMTNKTVLLITHRQAALGICNRQVIMTEEGIYTIDL